MHLPYTNAFGLKIKALIPLRINLQTKAQIRVNEQRKLNESIQVSSTVY